MNFSDGLIRLVNLANNFNFPNSSRKLCKPFMVGHRCVGLIPPMVLKALRRFPEVFIFHIADTVCGDGVDNVMMVELNPQLKTVDERSHQIASVLDRLRSENDFLALKQWRNEEMDIFDRFHEPPIFRIERAAASLFGVKKAGVHINGYTWLENGSMAMWLAKRAMNKPTWPGLWDQLAAGNIATGESPFVAAGRECYEEASITDDLLAKLTPTGCISYMYEDNRGVFPEIQYVLDLELPLTFEPKCNDGEVDHFQLFPIEQVKPLIISPSFKFNCACVVVDFMIRHGIITPENEPNYYHIFQGIHTDLLSSKGV